MRRGSNLLNSDSLLKNIIYPFQKKNSLVFRQEYLFLIHGFECNKMYVNTYQTPLVVVIGIMLDPLFFLISRLKCLFSSCYESLII